MTPHMLDFVRALAWHIPIQGPVLEVGSRIEGGQEHLDLRQAFPRGTKYVGSDIVGGPGVENVVDIFDGGNIGAMVENIQPALVLCLYTLEHVWEIQQIAGVLAKIWNSGERWLIVSTHQCEPYHGTPNYGDYWRITASGMKRLFDETATKGSSIFVHSDSSNPRDVVAIRQPKSMTWPGEAVAAALRATTAHWEQVY